ncbi:hypothetical protein G9A89_003560 [Geosiphon pyriformis]|nr:hypothetical protein G9A89_003560 [Geosiphon pyriformis]
MVMGDLYVGLDLSTQQLKFTAIDQRDQIVVEESVNFHKELPEFGTIDGVISHGEVVTSPTLMWVASVDKLFSKLKDSGFKFELVKAISGAGQQHGSIYWRRGASQILSNLNPDITLTGQLENAFSITNSPTWQDSSTTLQCRELERAYGGPKKLALVTGSKAYERFTGNQIAKIYKNHHEEYDKTERISLVSSFLASLLLGKYAPIDLSDGSGMNLLNIYTKNWDEKLLEACGGKELKCKLGKPVIGGIQIIGRMNEYFVSRYGFRNDCIILPFMGDNPASIISLKTKPGDAVISLGTSDTVLSSTTHVSPNTESHTLCHPTDQDTYISMLCYKNGSLTREYIRDKYTLSQDWSSFTEFLRQNPHPDPRKIGFYFLVQEIIPFAKGIHRFVDRNPVPEFEDSSYNIRAILESVFLSMKIRTKIIFGQKLERVIAIGGASQNDEILKVLADVFGVCIWRNKGGNSASLGAALKARKGRKNEGDFQRFGEEQQENYIAASPNLENTKIYDEMIPTYKELEKRVVSDQKND